MPFGSWPRSKACDVDTPIPDQPRSAADGRRRDGDSELLSPPCRLDTQRTCHVRDRGRTTLLVLARSPPNEVSWIRRKRSGMVTTVMRKSASDFPALPDLGHHSHGRGVALIFGAASCATGSVRDDPALCRLCKLAIEEIHNVGSTDGMCLLAMPVAAAGNTYFRRCIDGRISARRHAVSLSGDHDDFRTFASCSC